MYFTDFACQMKQSLPGKAEKIPRQEKSEKEKKEREKYPEIRRRLRTRRGPVRRNRVLRFC